MGMAVSLTSALPERVTIAEAGRQLGVGWRAVHQMIADGDLRVIDMPGGVRGKIIKSSLDELVARLKASVEQAG